MSTLTVTDIRRTGETASRSTRGIAASWLNLNGTGTIAVRDSQNVSSVTDNGAGEYAANFASAFADAEFSAVACAQAPSTSFTVVQVHNIWNAGPTLATNAPTTSKCDIALVNSGSPFSPDSAYVALHIHGDLA